MKAIPIARIRFASPTQSGPGFEKSSLTSCYDPENGAGKRYRIELHPWMQAYWIEYYDQPADAEGATLERSGYIRIAPGDWFTPVGGPVPNPRTEAPVAAPKPATSTRTAKKK